MIASLHATLNIWGAGILSILSRGLFFRKWNMTSMLDASMCDVVGAPATMSEHLKDNYRMALLDEAWPGTHATHVGGLFFAKPGLDRDPFSD